MTKDSRLPFAGGGQRLDGLLDRPAVAVGVGEEDEAAPGEVLDVADLAIEDLAAARLGISPADLRCLNVIQNVGVDNTKGLTAGELAREVGVTTGAITGTLDRMESAGYAERRVDPADRRRIRLTITPYFLERAEEIWAPLAADWQRRIGARFTAAELEKIVEFLQLTTEIGGEHRDRLSEEARKPH